MKKTKILGHRGAMGSAPENTRSSFIEAVEQGADGVEFDVQMTKDDKLVVIHDQTVDRTTDGSGQIKDFTLNEIKKLSILEEEKNTGKKKILTLEETLEIVGELSLINIEIKNGPILYPGIEEKIINRVREFGIADKVIVSSFNHYSVYTAKEIAPDIKAGVLLMSGLYKPCEFERKVGVEAVHPYYLSINPETIKECQKKGIEVNIFGVNEEHMLKKFIDLEVNLIITDYPKKAIKIREEGEN